MTAGAVVTVQHPIKEPGGTRVVINLTWTVCIIKAGHSHLMLMVSTGMTGEDITTPWKELRWKSDQLTSKTVVLLVCLATEDPLCLLVSCVVYLIDYRTSAKFCLQLNLLKLTFWWLRWQQNRKYVTWLHQASCIKNYRVMKNVLAYADSH